jgi:beta-barrel assembly-enhancing protease
MRSIIFGCLLALTYSVWGQIDVNAPYQPLQAQGTMPDDFVKLTFEKVSEASTSPIEGLSKKASRDFIKGIHYGIDEILRSGKVLYGDPISLYVDKIGQNLIKDNPDLKNIRFYTLRSNVINAFSTKQGIIFVTQGLVAQLSNESQLAFVLAHEIAHYLKDHVIVGYKENIELAKSRNSYEGKIKQYSNYSKEKEFEADQIGLELYHRAGYSSETALEVFDVLAYSYLPFDLKDIPFDFLNDSVMVVPESFFATEFPKISFDEDYDDTKSSHPNIQSRREEIERLTGELTGWGSVVYKFSEEEFLFIRNLSRFESVRNDLYNYRYTDALYSIFLLESEYKDNLTLSRWKAQAWAGLLAFKLNGRMNVVYTSPNKVQGPSHQLHHLMRKFSKKQLITVAFRQVALSQQQFPEDAELKAILRFSLGHLVNDNTFKLSDYEKVGYEEARMAHERRINGLDADTLTESKETSGKELSKYERIRQEKSGKKPSAKAATPEFNEEDFYKYALADVIDSPFFLEQFKGVKEKADEERKKKDDFERLNYRDRAKAKKIEEDQRLMLGIKEVILLEPRVIKLKKNRLSPERSEELEMELRDVVNRLKASDKMDVYKIGMLEYKKYGTSMYNQKALLMNALHHIGEFDDMQLFPVDFAYFGDISNDYGTSKVCFVFIQSVNIPPSLPGLISASVFAPIWIVMAPVTFMTSFVTRFNVVVYDVDTYRFDGFMTYDIHGITNKTMMEVLMYDLMAQLAKEPAKNKKSK